MYGNTAKMNAANGKVTLTCKELESITTERDVKIIAKKKAVIEALDEIVVNSAKMIKLQKGDAAPTEPFVLGKEFVTFMTSLLQFQYYLLKHQYL